MAEETQPEVRRTARFQLAPGEGTPSSFSLMAMLRALPKAASRRFKAAFAKLRLVTLVELLTHAPLAARAAPVERSEQALAEAIWGKVPERSLVIGDRLFGTGKTLHEAMSAFTGRDIQLLVRIRKNLKRKRLEPLSDGSALIEVAVRTESGEPVRLKLREIRAHGLGIHGNRFALSPGAEVLRLPTGTDRA